MSDLLVNSLKIAGYRMFRHLEIPKLGRVNLIVGKNNVGKTALLEALRLFAYKSSRKTVREILQSRDELTVTDTLSNGPYFTETQLDVKNLFNGRKDFRTESVSFEITVNDSVEGKEVTAIEWYRHIYSEYGDIDVIPVKDLPDLAKYSDATASLVTKADGKYIASLDLSSLYGNTIGGEKNDKALPAQYIPAYGLSKKDLLDLWERVALTDAEELVLDALRLLVPDVQKLNFLAKGQATQIPYVKLKNLSEPVPLKSTGEGVNRLFGMALALVSARNGLLLVDEVEIGFHYSILPKVWQLIFETAAKLNVQVFATTHSWDCIEAFQDAAAKHPEDGVLVRLENREGEMKVTTFDEKRLAIAARERIEVR